MQYNGPQGADQLPAFSTTSQNGSTALTPSQPQPAKRHAACDECRKRKLKCSGELSGCSRCLKQSLVCHYSEQKQMGRPPKKRMREDDESLAFLNLPGNDLWTNSEHMQIPSSGFGLDVPAISEGSQLLPPMYPAPFSLPSTDTSQISTDEDNRQSWQPAPRETAGLVPTTTSPWPDFSSVSEAAPNPFAMPPGFTPPITSLDSGLSSDNECSCLSYLYLWLSHLSSLKPFPISQHTICSLHMAAKTAQAVIRCQACPTKYDTSFQNVMFAGTLLNVIADSWLRVSKTDAAELGNQLVSSEYAAAINKSADPPTAWKDWLRQLVRRWVIHGPIDPAGNVTWSGADEVPSMLCLVEEMEARQRRWHENPDSHPLPADQRLDHPSDGSCLNAREEHDLLCLRVAKSARKVIAKFDFQADDYPDNVPCLTPDGSTSS